MKFYSLPVTINDRREILLELNLQDQQVNDKSYVIEVPAITAFNLVGILRDSVIKTFAESCKDLPIKNLELYTEYEDGVASIVIKEKIEEKADAPKAAAPPKERLSYEEFEDYKNPEAEQQPVATADKGFEEEVSELGQINDSLSLSVKVQRDAYSLRCRQTKEIGQHLFDQNQLIVNIVLQANDGTYANTLALYLAHPSQFLGLALDFGSESSQMAVKRYAHDYNLQEKRPEIENLFRNIVSYHKSNGWVPQHEAIDYYQEEKNTNFYKSLFFLKEQLSGDYEDIDKEVFIKNIADNLKMLVNTKDGYQSLTEQRFHQLPNLKIIHKHEDLLSGLTFEIEKDGYAIPIKLSELKQKVYNTILKVMINSFLKKEFIRYNNATRFIRMMLLVPNMYDTADINYIQHQLHNIFRDLSEGEYKGKILAWEVLTISESDASFIGYINKHNIQAQKDKDYIIIDSGKGTTDFSVIHTGSDNIFDLKPIYRNGFTGAGNMITYAVFETLLHYLRQTAATTQSDVKYIKDKVVRVLTSNDLERKNKFYTELERLKFNYKPGLNKEQVRTTWDHAVTGDIGFKDLMEYGDGINTLIGLLNNLENVADFYNYIDETCEFIAGTTVRYLKLIKENKRDFNCAGIILTGRSFMFGPLVEKLKSKLVAELGVSESSISLLSSTELKDICIKGVFNNSIKLNAELTGYPIQLIFEKENVPPPVAVKESTPKKSFFARLFNDLNNFEQAGKVLTFDQNLNFDKLQTSQFLIGSKTYRIMGSDIFRKAPGQTYEADIAFTHKGYVVRRMVNGVVDSIAPMRAIDDTGNDDMALIVPSLFPNYIDEKYLQSIERNDIEKIAFGIPADNTQPPANNNPLYF
ncbi:MAG: hypothetical protein QM642_07655 [Edaphocola sp.]